MYEPPADGNNERAPSVLITGGSGLVGKHLASLLLSHGFRVSVLTRNSSSENTVSSFFWNPAKKIIDPGAFKGVDYLVHLAGSGIGDMRWTKRRKEQIVSSRVRSTEFLHEVLTKNKITLKAFISASAIGYYGSVTSDRIFIEEDPPSDDFLGTTCRLWEEAADLFEKSGIRTVKIRTAVILERDDSALSRLMIPARFGLVVRLGSGDQFFPWIHIDDLCNIYLKAINDPNMRGAYNAVSAQFVNHREFVAAMAKAMGRKVFLPPVPAWILRIVLGEMSDIILKGSRISGDKIIRSGYRFRFDSLDTALRNIISG